MTSASDKDSEGGGPTSEAVARAFREGGRDAVSAVRKRVRRILAYRGYRIPREELKDLEQEIMTQLWRSTRQEGFRAQAGFWGLVETVTTRRCIDWMRAHRWVPDGEVASDAIPAETPGPLDVMLAREDRDRALLVFADLSKPCRDLIYLQVALQLPYREIAGLLGTTEGAARVRLHRCLEQARRALAEAQSRAYITGRETE